MLLVGYLLLLLWISVNTYITTKGTGVMCIQGLGGLMVKMCLKKVGFFEEEEEGI